MIWMRCNALLLRHRQLMLNPSYKKFLSIIVKQVAGMVLYVSFAKF